MILSKNLARPKHYWQCLVYSKLASINCFWDLKHNSCIVVLQAKLEIWPFYFRHCFHVYHWRPISGEDISEQTPGHPCQCIHSILLLCRHYCAHPLRNCEFLCCYYYFCTWERNNIMRIHCCTPQILMVDCYLSVKRGRLNILHYQLSNGKGILQDTYRLTVAIL